MQRPSAERAAARGRTRRLRAAPPQATRRRFADARSEPIDAAWSSGWRSARAMPCVGERGAAKKRSGRATLVGTGIAEPRHGAHDAGRPNATHSANERTDHDSPFPRHRFGDHPLRRDSRWLRADFRVRHDLRHVGQRDNRSRLDVDRCHSRHRQRRFDDQRHWRHQRHEKRHQFELGQCRDVRRHGQHERQQFGHRLRRWRHER